jgi:DNA polymerase-3 subunit epsilon
MTRGQDDLTIDLIDYSATGENGSKKVSIPTDLIYFKASELDCTEHERILEDISKASKKTPIWGL